MLLLIKQVSSDQLSFLLYKNFVYSCYVISIVEKLFIFSISLDATVKDMSAANCGGVTSGKLFQATLTATSSSGALNGE
jgi:hypothetical protein